MADDQNQRPYRSNEPPVRANAAAPRVNSGNDPLAELARLIGQTDPFAEYGRDNARRPAAAAAPKQQAPATDWPPPHAEHRGASAPEGQAFPPPNFGRPAFGGAPLNATSDLYRTEQEEASFPATQPGFQDDAYDPNQALHGAEHQDLYDDAPRSRRRLGVMAVAGIFALAVVGTAGAFGYRAIFGSSTTSGPPPMIKADPTPSKVMASANKDAQSGKQITDRVNDKAGGATERLVSREEQPVEIRERLAPAVFPPPQDVAQSTNMQVLGSGVVGSEPKRVRTISIHPDQQSTAEAPASAPAPAPARTATVAPARVASASAQDADAGPRPNTTRVAPAVRPAAATPADSNAPLSLTPDAPSRAAAPARTAAVAPAQTAAPAAAGAYVQLSSQRSEAEAQAAFRSLQGKYPDQLGGKQPSIRKAELGAKGTYYRAMVGPFAKGSEAVELCTSLKAAGGQCIVQRN